MEGFPVLTVEDPRLASAVLDEARTDARLREIMDADRDPFKRNQDSLVKAVVSMLEKRGDEAAKPELEEKAKQDATQRMEIVDKTRKIMTEVSQLTPEFFRGEEVSERISAYVIAIFRFVLENMAKNRTFFSAEGKLAVESWKFWKMHVKPFTQQLEKLDSMMKDVRVMFSRTLSVRANYALKKSVTDDEIKAFCEKHKRGFTTDWRGERLVAKDGCRGISKTTLFGFELSLTLSEKREDYSWRPRNDYFNIGGKSIRSVATAETLLRRRLEESMMMPPFGAATCLCYKCQTFVQLDTFEILSVTSRIVRRAHMSEVKLDVPEGKDLTELLRGRRYMRVLANDKRIFYVIASSRDTCLIPRHAPEVGDFLSVMPQEDEEVTQCPRCGNGDEAWHRSSNMVNDNPFFDKQFCESVKVEQVHISVPKAARKRGAKKLATTVHCCYRGECCVCGVVTEKVFSEDYRCRHPVCTACVANNISIDYGGKMACVATGCSHRIDSVELLHLLAGHYPQKKRKVASLKVFQGAFQKVKVHMQGEKGSAAHVTDDMLLRCSSDPSIMRKELMGVITRRVGQQSEKGLIQTCAGGHSAAVSAGEFTECLNMKCERCFEKEKLKPVVEYNLKWRRMTPADVGEGIQQREQIVQLFNGRDWNAFGARTEGFPKFRCHKTERAPEWLIGNRAMWIDRVYLKMAESLGQVAIDQRSTIIRALGKCLLTECTDLGADAQWCSKGFCFWCNRLEGVGDNLHVTSRIFISQHGRAAQGNSRLLFPNHSLMYCEVGKLLSFSRGFFDPNVERPAGGYHMRLLLKEDRGEREIDVTEGATFDFYGGAVSWTVPEGEGRTGWRRPFITARLVADPGREYWKIWRKAPVPVDKGSGTLLLDDSGRCHIVPSMAQNFINFPVPSERQDRFCAVEEDGNGNKVERPFICAERDVYVERVRWWRIAFDLRNHKNGDLIRIIDDLLKSKVINPAMAEVWGLFLNLQSIGVMNPLRFPAVKEYCPELAGSVKAEHEDFCFTAMKLKLMCTRIIKTYYRGIPAFVKDFGPLSNMGMNDHDVDGETGEIRARGEDQWWWNRLGLPKVN